MSRFLVLVGFIWLSWLTQGQTQNPLFSPAPSSPVKVGQESGQVILADVNRDGQLDLITRHLQQQLVTVQLGDGQGDFTAAAHSRLDRMMSPCYENYWTRLPRSLLWAILMTMKPSGWNRTKK